MRTTKKIFLAGFLAWMLAIPLTYGQKIDDARMDRDIEIAENILSTLIMRKLEMQRAFSTLEVRGSYLQGYGVIFRVPADYGTPMAMNLRGNSDITLWNNDQGLTHSVGSGDPVNTQQPRQQEEEQGSTRTTYSLKDNVRQRAYTRDQKSIDSTRNMYYVTIVSAMKDFILDYGDLINQLPANERIVVTTKGNYARNIIVDQFLNIQPPTLLSVEGLKSNITAFKQGKLTRTQAWQTLKTTSDSSVDKVEPEMELLSIIFNRLYRPDLSKTYFTDENIYYEHLDDFGAMYYMQVYSAWRMDPLNPERIAMPTLGLVDVEPELRDKKAKELYPIFEQELKANMLEYGRTLKGLGDNESLIFNVMLTQCRGCGIPATLELSIKASVLKDFGAGKLDQSAALNKFQIKKGPLQ